VGGVAVVAPLSELVERAQPVSLAGERLLPVLPALRPLLPAEGLRRGSVMTVGGGAVAGLAGAAGSGATSLGLSLLAAASAEGSWCAAVGLPALGLAAAAELGVVLERFPVVASPGPGSGPGGWAWVVAALLDACDVVLAGLPARSGLRAADARRLTARVRERSAVLVVVGDGWSEPAEIRLTVASSTWEGVGRGHGRLRARQVEVVGGGRGAAARERRVPLWLPHPEGGVAPCTNGGDSKGVIDERRAHARRVVS
jgi:hypothetical protein